MGRQFNINNFQAEVINGKRLARTEMFEVLVSPPSISFVMSPTNRGIPMRALAVNLPSRSIQTTDHKYHGPLRKVPYSTMAGEISLTVLLSPDYSERDLFYEWQELAVGAGQRTNSGGNYARGMWNTVNYYSDIIGTMEITTFDGDGEPTHKTTLRECYPLGVNEVALSWGEVGLAQLNVTMYSYTFSTEKLGMTGDIDFA